MKYVLEPMVFALDENASEKEFKQYVNRLLQWDYWFEKHPDDIYVLSSTEDVLFEESLFPIYPVFDALMQKYKLDYVQVSDLNATISRIITNAKKIDKVETAVEYDVVLNDLSFGVDADVEFRSQKMRDSFEMLLKYIYAIHKDRKMPMEKYVLFCKNVINSVTLDITYYTMEEMDGEIKTSDKKTDQVSMVCCSSLKDFFSSKETPNRILHGTSCKDDISLAVRVAVYQNGCLKKVMDTYRNYDFKIQKSFYADFCTAHYFDNDTVLTSLMEAMSHTLLNKNMAKREDFRTGKGGNNPQLKSPNKEYLAWRRFVTTSIKTQYWQKDEKYRFANVGEHDHYVCKWEDD